MHVYIYKTTTLQNQHYINNNSYLIEVTEMSRVWSWRREDLEFLLHLPNFCRSFSSIFYENDVIKQCLAPDLRTLWKLLRKWNSSKDLNSPERRKTTSTFCCRNNKQQHTGNCQNSTQTVPDDLRRIRFVQVCLASPQILVKPDHMVQ